MKISITILLLFNALNFYCQSKAEELRDCSSQKYYVEDFKGSIECLDKLIALNPKDSSAYNNRGLIKEILKDYCGAIKDYTLQMNIDATFADTYFFRAMAKDKINDIKGAILDYNKTVEYEPKNSDAYYFRGLNQFKLKNNNAALKDYKRALEKREDNYTVYADIGLIKAQSKNYKLALNYCNKAIALDKRCDKAYYYKGWIKAQQNKYFEAIKDFEIVLNYNPNLEKELNYGNLKLNYKGFKLALSKYNKELNFEKTDSTYLKRGLLNYYLKDYKNTIQNLNRAIELNPNLAAAYFYRAQAFGKTNYTYESISDYKKYLEFDTKNDIAYFNMALEYEKNKELDISIVTISKAIEINPYDPEYYLKRGQLLLKSTNGIKGCEDVITSKKLGGIYQFDYKKYKCK